MDREIRIEPDDRRMPRILCNCRRWATWKCVGADEGCARRALTDSGGVQEETTALGVPLHYAQRQHRTADSRSTEGTNTVVGQDPEKILAAFDDIMQTGGKAGRIPEFWGMATRPFALRVKFAAWLNNMKRMAKRRLSSAPNRQDAEEMI